ncbi:DUF2500 family protein [Blastopirellula marina]|uniref:Uncharacterized protein n=1 Tax=Blastopirellula marina DSM 3645 TaxID=314230 RepID=A3ZNP1_9BACT|nr:DUF2500 family protein [Blastopirellula marina]EAQ81939.1 hypothetical protein DSM3645_17345 [Blastopirellula marina DSM 3645]
MKCDSCSADISPDSLRCAFCGSHVHRAAPVAHAPKSRSRSDIFAQIKSSPQFQAAALGQGLEPQSAPFALYAQAGFLTLFIGVTIFMTIVFALMAGPMCIVPLGMALFGCFMLAKSGSTIHSFATSPATPIPAIVATKRVEMRGKNGNMACYFATFEYESGDREEFPIWERKLFGQLAEDDAGVLIRRGEIAVGFRRVPR